MQIALREFCILTLERDSKHTITKVSLIMISLPTALILYPFFSFITPRITIHILLLRL